MDQSIRDLKHKEYNSIFTSNWLEINKRQANYHLLSNCKTINLDEAKHSFLFCSPSLGRINFLFKLFSVFTQSFFYKPVSTVENYHLWIWFRQRLFTLVRSDTDISLIFPSEPNPNPFIFHTPNQLIEQNSFPFASLNYNMIRKDICKKIFRA